MSKYDRMHTATSKECDADCWEGFIYGDSKCRHGLTYKEATEKFKRENRNE